MAILITADDIAMAIGLPFASTTDEDWAVSAAAAISSYINGLSIAAKPEKVDQVMHAAKMVAADAYHRRARGSISPDFGDLGSSEAYVNFRLLDQLLETGRFQKPVVA